jgi:hypothetical protein
MTEYDLSDCGIDGLGTIEVEGVENRELFDQQHQDVGAPLLWPGITLRSHPYDRVRSHCFIASLFP